MNHRFYFAISVVFTFLKPSFSQIFNEVPMGMPMMMPMQYPFIGMGNPFDQGMDIEYSPITQLVSSIAHLVEMHQKSKERLGDHEDHRHGLFPQLQELQELQQGIQMRGRPGMSGPNGPHFSLIPYTQEGLGSSTSSSASRLVNSISSDQVPSVMWRIGDLIGKGTTDKTDKENLYDMRKIKGFPIVKSSDEDINVKMRDPGDKEKENKSWTILEIARKILGVDEIPTAKEGNAIAQLLEELRKEKGQNSNF